MNEVVTGFLQFITHYGRDIAEARRLGYPQSVIDHLSATRDDFVLRLAEYRRVFNLPGA